jgi:hypothetical protein
MSYEDPKSTTGEFDLPGGVVWEHDGTTTLLKHIAIRELSGNEEDILANRKLAVEDKVMQILSKCTINLSDTNENSFIIDKPMQIGKAIQDMQITDLIYGILLIRIVSLGSTYKFKVKCTDNDCGYESNYVSEIDDLEVKYPEEPEKLIWEIELPASKKMVKMKAMQAKDQKKAGIMLRQSKDLMTTKLLTRVIEIDGHPPNVKDLKNLSLRDRNAIRNSFIKKEGGIETDIDVTCNSCGNTFAVRLEVLSADFFFPSET